MFEVNGADIGILTQLNTVLFLFIFTTMYSVRHGYYRRLGYFFLFYALFNITNSVDIFINTRKIPVSYLAFYVCTYFLLLFFIEKTMPDKIQRFNIIYMISGAPYFLFGELSSSIYTIHLFLYSLACLFFLYIFQEVSKNNNIVRGNNTVLSLSFILLSSMYMGEFFSSFYLDDLRYIEGFRFFFYVVATIIKLLSVHNFILFSKKGDVRGLIKSLIYLFGLLGLLITGNIIIDRVISYNREKISIELSEKLENHKDIFINQLNK
ncbi:MAG: hypothetical protein ACOCWO_01690, partial [Candidatus Muiribacteriaceae bacterium]